MQLHASLVFVVFKLMYCSFTVTVKQIFIINNGYHFLFEFSITPIYNFFFKLWYRDHIPKQTLHGDFTVHKIFL
jgi:hypothetical protein